MKRYFSNVMRTVMVMLAVTQPLTASAADHLGIFTLGDKILHVPRDYLWMGKNNPNGPAQDNTLYLIVDYPSLKPGRPDGNQTNNITIVVRDGRLL